MIAYRSGIKSDKLEEYGLSINGQLTEPGYAAFKLSEYLDTLNNNEIPNIKIGNKVTNISGLFGSLAIQRIGYNPPNNIINFINIPNGVRDCSHLFENMIYRVGSYGMSSNIGLELKIPETVTNIDNMFKNCSYFNFIKVNIKFPSNLQHANNLFDNVKYTDVFSCIGNSINLPSNMKSAKYLCARTTVNHNINNILGKLPSDCSGLLYNATICNDLFLGVEYADYMFAYTDFRTDNSYGARQIIFNREITSLYRAFYNFYPYGASNPNYAGPYMYYEPHIYIRGTNINNVTEMFMGRHKVNLRNASNGIQSSVIPRIHLHFHGSKNALFNKTSGATLTGMNTSWVAMTNGFYNTAYNIYCYYNYNMFS